MPNFIDLTGHVFGRLTAIEFRSPKWLFRCECGNEKLIWPDSVKRGLTRSCGCLNKEASAERGRKQFTRHGLSKTAEHKTWQTILQRCLNPRDKDFDCYGGRGIKVCERWQVFENFLADMGKRPNGRSIDRIDVNGDYEPTNCRWATPTQQSINRRSALKIEAFGRTGCLAEFIPARTTAYSKARTLIHRGVPHEEAIRQCLS